MEFINSIMAFLSPSPITAHAYACSDPILEAKIRSPYINPADVFFGQKIVLRVFLFLLVITPRQHQ